MPIRVLPAELVSAIAAGEVVERPASVVRELLENSLDAGATRIAVHIEGAGQARIEVSDDGQGIPAAELAVALGRHSTSKLDSLEGLFAVRTLGFRGEALASIAAVSHFEIVSRAATEPAGASLRADGGKAARPRAVGAPVGTQVIVRDLFFNTPARRKFLKSDNTERRRIVDLVGRYAVGYPHVAFELTSDGRAVIQTTGSGRAREALTAIIDLETASAMLELGPTEGPVSIRGFVSPPTVHRSSRRDLTFFVNGRWVQDPGLSAGVVQAYHGLLMVGRFPLGFLHIVVDPAEIDVNVHPSKAEVRFRRPDQVVGAVQRTVRATLLGQARPPQAELGQGWAPPAEAPASGWRLPEPPERGAEATPPTLSFGPTPLLRCIGQVGAAYLVAEGPDGLYLIDQHAAHERVLFEKLVREWTSGGPARQAVLDLAPVELTRTQAETVAELIPALARIGIEIEPFGGTAVRVRSLPALLADLDPAEALRAATGDFEEDEAALEGAIEERLAARVCKRGAIRAGQILSLAEQERLVGDLEACASPRTCPHGRPTMIHISVEALERQFGRRG